MDSKAFVEELAAANQALLDELGDVRALADSHPQPRDGLATLLRVALANEISVAELAARWMPTVADWDIKIALAQQAGDEARHFILLEKRLATLGISLADFAPPAENKLFAYLNSLETPVEKIAAGQFTLEALAYKVNDAFLRYCELVGDKETAQLYRNFIQPDELFHHQLGRRLLEKHARSDDDQRRARQAVTKTLAVARELRAAAAQKLGTACFPGC
ncbi:MAG: ferritin-like domain-containing protein [Acidobacteria bacterium]|nr:ferritin-like domain-containing protein [Acidobacteriota bacterium]